MRSRWLVATAASLTAALLCYVALLRSFSAHQLPQPGYGLSSLQTTQVISRSEILARLSGPLQPDSPELIQKIREKYLVPPSDKPYDLRYEHKSLLNLSWVLIGSILEDFFSKKDGGFFVEAGALDGEYMSNTLQLERRQKWTGLLVEPDPNNFVELLDRHRKAWLSPSCLSTHDYPETAVLKRDTDPNFGPRKLNKGTGRIVKSSDLSDPGGLFNSLFSTAQCLPLASLLLALNVTHVDLFVLDVESVEESVLANFPFDKVTVDLWAIEHVTGSAEDETFIRFMIGKGYYYFDKLCADVPDYIFVRKKSELFHILKVPVDQENRTELCTQKYYQTGDTLDLSLDKIRDRHHYPDLTYSNS